MPPFSAHASGTGRGRLLALTFLGVLDIFVRLRLDISYPALSKNKPGGTSPEFDFKSFEDRFSEAMDEDFNTPQAVALIFDFVKDAYRTIAEKESIHNNFYITFKNFLSISAGDVLGIISFEEKEVKQDSLLENELIKILIDIRLKAKNEKNFQLADDIRKKLENLGITLKVQRRERIFLNAISINS